MKTKAIILIAVLIAVIPGIYGAEWRYYGNQNLVNCSAEEGNYLWAGTWSGLVKLNMVTGQKTYYDKTNSGLPDLYVKSVMIDTQGIKWIGTLDGGLCRFDGTDWTVWNTSNSAIPHNSINAIAFDAYNNVWVATDGGLGRLSNNNWTSWNTTNSDMPTNYLNCIAIDASGTKWIGTNQALITFSGNTISQVVTDSGAMAIVIDNQDVKWVAFYSLGLGKLNGNTWTYYTTENSDIPFDELGFMDTAANGNLWLANYANLTKFDGSTWTTWDIPDSGVPMDYVTSMTIDDSSGIWLGSRYSGMKRFDGITWQTVELSNAGQLVPVDINRIVIDSQNRKWIGMESGFSLFANDSWTIWNPLYPAGQVMLDVANIAVDTDNVVWADCDNGSTRDLYSFNGTDWTLHQPAEFGLNEIDICCINTDNQNNMWIGTGQSLVKLNGTSYTIYNSTNSPINNYVRDVVRDVFGNIWVATSGDGLLLYNGTVWTSFTTSNSNIPSNGIIDLDIDSYGNKWMATSMGLCRYDDVNFTIWNTQNSNIPSNIVYSLCIGSANQIWITTTGGLSRFHGGVWTSWSGSNSPIPDNDIRRVTIDAQGNKWIASDDGIYVFNEDEIVANEDDATPSISQQIDISIYPNPFNPTTNITYSLPKDGFTKASIYNIRGQLVKTLINEPLNSGNHRISWNGLDNQGIKQASGVYFVRIEHDGKSSVRKMLMLK